MTLGFIERYTERVAFLGLLALASAIVLLSCGLGAVAISPGQILEILLHELGFSSGDPSFTRIQRNVLLSIRLPRTVMGCLVGSSLAVAGASLQGLFRNPLADPGLIGVSSGAALGVVGMIVCGAPLIAALDVPGAITWITPGAAFLGGSIATLVVLRLATNQGRIDVATMLLAGIAINAACGALIGLATYASDEAQLRSLTMWSLGSIGGATWTNTSIVAACIVPGCAWLVRQAGALDVFALGMREAGHLGIDVRRTQRGVVLLSALVVGAGVGFTGMIGFVGLVVPHLLRLAVGPSHRWLLPASTLAGASLLLGADLIARTIVAPAELPIGVVTAILGAPFFVFLLMRAKHAGGI
ncbi:MAG: iron ABC transporter permease [Myxococcota bacterium]